MTRFIETSSRGTLLNVEHVAQIEEIAGLRGTTALAFFDVGGRQLPSRRRRTPYRRASSRSGAATERFTRRGPVMYGGSGSASRLSQGSSPAMGATSFSTALGSASARPLAFPT